MPARIKLFRSVQKFHQWTGIYPSEPNQSYSFDLRSAVILLSLILPCISSAIYFLFKTQTIAERAQMFYLSLTEICMIVNFVTMCLEMRNILQLIGKYEEFIQKRKCSRLTILHTF